eukprot:CAMPEP_0202967154 /NCGR_PEP_ID=MMETSP1396-20130829/11935_1 /ASSEMBLY_ACC=CAM_ASM_000872 /TAXON_ID= /ORGANISM="Pseudokeronopsis sp., Strain Brazil" /LENGTH=82 /DNA_ID=CAMNT_0049691899 /DNA_START=930 /DNA_END=1178 /DNA_ORIENTATION=+
MKKVCVPSCSISEKILYYESKKHAIEDCLVVIKQNEDMRMHEMLKLVRKLSSKQFMTIVKISKLRLALGHQKNNGFAGYHQA